MNEYNKNLTPKPRKDLDEWEINGVSQINLSKLSQIYKMVDKEIDK